jgi:hypothetical protein
MPKPTSTADVQPTVSPTTPPTTNGVVTPPPTTLPFVWDSYANIAQFPAEHYSFSDCPNHDTVLASGAMVGIADLSPGPLYPDVAALGREVDTIFVGTVEDVMPAFTWSASNLPDEYLEATGLGVSEDLAWSYTPTVMTVDQLVWGETDKHVVLDESGCYVEGDFASLTPGATLLVLAQAIDPQYGPYPHFGGTHHIIDWFAIDASQRLTPRVGFLGLPPLAPFLDGLELDKAVSLLAGGS